MDSPSGIDPKNLAAQLAYRGAGNPPSAHPSSAISNAYPGLEMDFRNIWKRLFEGIELHEASNLVVAVDPEAPAPLPELLTGYVLETVDGIAVEAQMTGPLYPTQKPVPLHDTTFHETAMPLEWSNVLAEIVPRAGELVSCVFRSLAKHGHAAQRLEVQLRVRPFFAADADAQRLAVIAREIAAPGQLTQSLCSPWQNDYRECACFYWAASRPDYVNVEVRPDGTSAGHNWMQKDRTPTTPLIYIEDPTIADRNDPRLVTYDDLFRAWERELRFIIGGQDAE
jgi:hypothetical protein